VATSAPHRRNNALDRRPSALGERNPSIPFHRRNPAENEAVCGCPSMISVVR
jgi:hypothetical protein